MPRPRKNNQTLPSPRNPVLPDVVVRDRSYIEVHGPVRIEASEMAIVSVYGDAEVVASDQATIIAWGGSPRVELRGDAVCVDRCGSVHTRKAGDS